MLRAVYRHGDRLAYAELGKGPGPAIVFIHGWGGYRSFLAAQQSSFAMSCCTIAVDLRGHGASDAPSRGCRVTDLAEDVVFLCEYLDVARFLLVGHGLGGAIALEAAALRPDLVGGVAMIDGFVCPKPDAVASVALAAGGQPCEDARLACLSPLLFHRADDPAIRRLVANSVNRTSSYALQAMLQHLLDHDCASAALRASMPVSYVATENAPTDVVTFATLCRRLSVVRLEGVGHFAPVLQPERVTAALAGFVSGAVASTLRPVSEIV